MRILIVEDHPLVQEALHSMAAEVFEDPLIEMASSLAEALEKARAAGSLDLVLLDLGLPDCNGIETLKRFRRAHPRIRVAVFSEIEEPPLVLAAMQAGACGFLSKTLTRPVISAALRLVAAGGTYIPPQATGAWRGAMSLSRRRARLTDRQLDVVRLIAKGFRNKQIAERLRIAEDTVKQQARVAYAALGV